LHQKLIKGQGNDGQAHRLGEINAERTHERWFVPGIVLPWGFRKIISTDGDELVRARWFWRRRPNKLILSPHKILRLITLFLWLWMTSLSVCDRVQATHLAGIIAWGAAAAIAVAVFVDIFRYAQWKWEYYRAVSRFFATANR